MAIICARRRRPAERSDVRRPAARGAGRRADAHAVAGGGAPEHHAGDRRSATSSRRSCACTIDSSSAASARVRPVTTAADRPRTDGPAGRAATRRAHGCRVAGVVTGRRRRPALLESQRFRRTSTSPSISPSARAVKTESGSAWPTRGWNVVIGTTGWQADEAACGRSSERAGIGVLAAANFSIGMHVFRRDRRRGGAPVCGDAGCRRVDPRSASRAKKDAPSGTALMLKDAMETGRLRAADRRLVHARRLDSRHARSRIRCAGGDRDADAHRPRPRRVRARRARSREVAQGPSRLVHDGRHDRCQWFEQFGVRSPKSDST